MKTVASTILLTICLLPTAQAQAGLFSWLNNIKMYQEISAACKRKTYTELAQQQVMCQKLCRDNRTQFHFLINFNAMAHNYKKAFNQQCQAHAPYLGKMEKNLFDEMNHF
jgi:hypothetical protein